MPIDLKWLFKLPKGRLSRRIALWVFISVIVIETIIFIPSYYNRKKELHDQVRSITTAKINLLMRMIQQEKSERELAQYLNLLEMDPRIRGGILFLSANKIIFQFGELPELTPTQVIDFGKDNLASRDSRYFDSAWKLKLSQQDYTLIIRQDATFVQKELLAFFLRIAGLVFLISMFVTAGALIALEPIIITPIFKLRGDLLNTGDAIKNDREPPKFYANSAEREDELGDVIAAFVKMQKQITDAINNRKRAEQSLQKSFRQVEAYSKALNKELEQGRLMQANFLPDKLPQVSGWEFATFFKPARQVSGDFYDVFELPNNQIGIVVADVCDKGVGAALFMALIRSLLRVFSGQTELKGLRLSSEKKPPEPVWSTVKTDYPELDQQTVLETVQMTNNYIIQNHERLGMFATLFFGVLQPGTGLLSYVSGGHDPLFLIDSAGRVNRLSPTGPAVGLIAAADFRIEQIKLEPGATILGCTDGVTEARSPQGSLYSRNRLEVLLNTQFASANDLIEHIQSNLFDFISDASQDDDITLLAVQRSPHSVNFLR